MLRALPESKARMFPCHRQRNGYVGTYTEEDLKLQDKQMKNGVLVTKAFAAFVEAGLGQS